VVDLLNRWQAQLAQGIRDMREQGKIPPRVDPDREAAALLAGLQGGVVVMPATGDISHLEIALDTAIERLVSTA
jgi:hypothetical protein